MTTRFCEEMKKYGNKCEVVPFEGLGHGFFNYNPAFFATSQLIFSFKNTPFSPKSRH